jgi:hypothetical protein
LPTKHLVIPDCQVKPGVDVSHLDHIGQYIIDKMPDVIVCIGDFADLPSLSSYDRGQRSAVGRTYFEDVQSVRNAMKRLLAPMRAYNADRLKRRKAQYRPRMVLTLGNHEDRIRRAIEEDARLYGTISLKDLGYEEDGWEVHPFLEVVVIDGIAYSHYFCSGPLGRPVTSARALVKAKHMSATMGHTQLSDIYMGDVRADGKPMIGLFCGTCYLHDEEYLGPQGNSMRRQIVVKHEVEDGKYDPMFVSLDYLRRRYGKPVRKAA